MDEITLHDSGPIRVGSRAVVRQPRFRPGTWVIDEITTERVFSWHTSGPGYRIVADHTFDASPKDGGTRARLSVAMTGLLAVPLWLLAGSTIRRYVDQEAAALKQCCEQDSRRR